MKRNETFALEVTFFFFFPGEKEEEISMVGGRGNGWPQGNFGNSRGASDVCRERNGENGKLVACNRERHPTDLLAGSRN